MPPPSESPIDDAAYRWLARRDRGFTPAEQDAYLEWLRADPRHAAAVARISRAWGALDALSEWRPAHSTAPNPNLLARPAARRRFFRPALILAGLAATLAAGLFLAGALPGLTRSSRDDAPANGATPPGIVRHEPRRLTLPDGSIVALLGASEVRVAYSAEERRVKLEGGEAHFTVAKAPHRPFVVEVRGVAVRAVGTAFNVQVAPDAVAVLVTEGQVRLERPPEAPGSGGAVVVSNISIPNAPAAHPAPPATAAPAPVAAATTIAGVPGEGALLRNGERAVVSLAEPSAPPQIAAASSAELAAALDWQTLRLTFNALPLREVAAEMNRHNRRQLRIGDTAAGAIRIGGTFRADNIEALIRLLENGFGVIIQTHGDETVVYTRGPR